MKISWRLVIFFTAFLLLILPFSASAISPEMEYELDQQIQAELQLMIENLLRPQFVCEEYLGLEYPVPEPTSSIMELRERLEETVDKESLEKYPESQRAEFLAEAKRRFSLLSQGNKVEIELIDGRTVKGWLRRVGEFDVQIDAHQIRFEQMTDDTRARFNEDLSQRRIDRFVAQEMDVWRDLRATYRNRIREQRERDMFKAAGYILKFGEWIPLRTYFEDELIDQRGALAERLRPLLKTRIYMEHGFRNYNGVWMTAEEIEQRELLEAEKNAFDSRFEAEMDKLNAENAGRTAGVGVADPELMPEEDNGLF